MKTWHIVICKPEKLIATVIVDAETVTLARKVAIRSIKAGKLELEWKPILPGYFAGDYCPLKLEVVSTYRF